MTLKESTQKSAVIKDHKRKQKEKKDRENVILMNCRAVNRTRILILPRIKTEDLAAISDFNPIANPSLRYFFAFSPPSYPQREKLLQFKVMRVFFSNETNISTTSANERAGNLIIGFGWEISATKNFRGKRYAEITSNETTVRNHFIKVS